MARTCAFIAAIAACSWVPAFAADTQVLEQGRALMSGASYYAAVVALEPLLLGQEKSDAQQEAYFLADKACMVMTTEYEYLLILEFEKLHGLSTGKDMEWAKIKTLNRLGAGITWSHMGGTYDYQRAFLRKLVERYPDGSYAPAARFYVIRPGVNDENEVQRELRELRAYIKNYPDLKEKDLARLKIARIYDNLWELLFEGPPGRVFSSGDREKDLKRAADSRMKALAIYRELVKSDKLDAATLKEINDRRAWLKALKPSGRFYIFSD